ncbi:efflux RND transporter periplasmic adaptor subunit [Oceaniglobus trochenteri]|uniref:efflux RND transporter periplasmic adaptor subunit n=1 Tax=Oceaniglobus trochenteri TaxID=2763260 RepID=UPI001CFFB405|nr:efflux RND transporter periplasmic adaptor subunit [Oceaniglobus trochenteri]
MADDSSAKPKTLAFDNDAGSSRSKWVASALVIGIVGWMGSGFFLPAEQPAEQAADETPAQRAVAVAVRRSVAEDVAQVFVAEGQAKPDRDTMIRAETSGQIGEVLVSKGADVTQGQIIARIDVASRAADLARAEEELARAQRDYDNAQALLERGVATADRVAQSRATLAAAQASVAEAKEATDNTELRAPFAGRLEALNLAEGEFVATGTEIGRVVDNTPLTITIQIPQQSLSDIKVGQSAEVNFITGAETKGEVTFVGSSADPQTRTFTAEIRVPNADGAVPAGISAKVRIPTGSVTAHFVSPAILSLGTDGTLGVKTVEDDNIVAFHEISIVRAQTDGIWVSGLPEEAQIVTIGQGFVNAGEKAAPQEEPEAAPKTDTGANETADGVTVPEPEKETDATIIEAAREKTQ